MVQGGRCSDGESLGMAEKLRASTTIFLNLAPILMRFFLFSFLKTCKNDNIYFWVCAAIYVIFLVFSRFKAKGKHLLVHDLKLIGYLTVVHHQSNELKMNFINITKTVITLQLSSTVLLPHYKTPLIAAQRCQQTSFVFCH